MDDDANPDTPRTATEIARRVIALHCTIAAAHGVFKSDLTEWLQEEHLWNELTPRELTFFSKKKNPRKEVIWMTWLVEAQVALLWSIGKLAELSPLTGKCNVGQVIAAVPAMFEPTSAFIKSAVRRSREKIKREEANIYDIHCNVDQAKRKRVPIPNGYDESVVFFRHYGLAWVTGYVGQSWDEVTPDT